MVHSRLVSTFDLFPFGQIKPTKNVPNKWLIGSGFKNSESVTPTNLGIDAQICMHVNLYLIDRVAKKQQQLSYPKDPYPSLE